MTEGGGRTLPSYTLTLGGGYFLAERALNSLSPVSLKLAGKSQAWCLVLGAQDLGDWSRKMLRLRSAWAT